MPEEIMGYRFKDPSLLHNALCHSSYANEHRGRGEHSNERLEFLGDAVLGVISAEYIYGRFTELPEGEMTKLRASIVCLPRRPQTAGRRRDAQRRELRPAGRRLRP